MAPRRPKTGAYMTYPMLVQALEARYPKREYALLQEVRNATGYASRVRSADFVALSLWPSRGLALHGFEIKQYRGDWKREKEAPEKAEEIAQYCDFWWLVVTEAAIAPLDEVPLTWGVLAPDDTGKKLVQLREATRLEPKPLSRGFIASLLRNAADGMVPVSSLEAKVTEAREAGIKLGEARVADVKELERLRTIEAAAREFEAASGYSINFLRQYGASPTVFGEAMKVLLNGEQEIKWKLDGLDRLATAAKDLNEIVRRQYGVIVAARVALKDSVVAPPLPLMVDQEMEA